MLEVNNITAGYGKMTILEDVSLYCKTNEVVLIFGPNGAGKTTLMQTIYGFADLHHGEIRYNGVDLTKRSPHDMLPLGIGYIRQRGGFFPSMTIKDNFRMALYLHKHYRLSDKLERVFGFFPRLKERLGQTAMTLSGGERQMLTIACVLIQEPDLILVDEMTAGLQPQLQEQIIEATSNFAREGNKGVIFIEHPVEKVLKIADRAYCLRDGKIVAEGPTDTFLNKTGLEKLYFGEAL